MLSDENIRNIRDILITQNLQQIHISESMKSSHIPLHDIDMPVNAMHHKYVRSHVQRDLNVPLILGGNLTQKYYMVQTDTTGVSSLQPLTVKVI